MQWAAVSTQSLLIRDPPQRETPKELRLTCQGQLPGEAVVPPTILLFVTATPHPERNRIKVIIGETAVRTSCSLIWSN